MASAGDVFSDRELDRKNRAEPLIENFMIAANGVTATGLESKKLTSLRQVLRSPERRSRIAQSASRFGNRRLDEPCTVTLEGFLARRRKADIEKFPDLSVTMVALIGRGEYKLDLAGGEPVRHFELAVKNYTHATAPKRRFPELIVQRPLKAPMAGALLPQTIPELAALATHCTKRKDAVTRIERRVRKSAAALLLSGRIGDHTTPASPAPPRTESGCGSSNLQRKASWSAVSSLSRAADASS